MLRLRIARPVIALLVLVSLTALPARQSSAGGLLGGLEKMLPTLPAVVKPSKNAGKLLGGVVVVATGVVIGTRIAALLQDERDRQQAARATETALKKKPTDGSPPTEAWKSDRDPAVHGSSTVTAADEDGSCKWVREVGYAGGREVTENTRYCRDRETGQWARS